MNQWEHYCKTRNCGCPSIILVLESIKLFWHLNFHIFTPWTNITNTISNICKPCFLQRCQGRKIREIQHTEDVFYSTFCALVMVSLSDWLRMMWVCRTGYWWRGSCCEYWCACWDCCCRWWVRRRRLGQVPAVWTLLNEASSATSNGSVSRLCFSLCFSWWCTG